MDRSRHLSLKQLMALVALLALPMASCLVPLGRRAEWDRLERRMAATIGNLTPSDPSSVSRIVWNDVQRATITAYGNICFSPEHTSTPEMYRLRDDLDRKLKGKVDLDTLVRVWERLGETGPHGKSYARRMRPLLDQCLPPRP